MPFEDLRGVLHYLNLEYIYYVIYTSTFGLGDPGSVDLGNLSPERTATSTASGGGLSLSQLFGAVGTILAAAWAAFSVFSYALSFLFALGALGALGALAYIRAQEEQVLYSTVVPYRTEPLEESRFERVLSDAVSDEPRRWKKAVLDADDMLGELLTALNLPGETTAERLSLAAKKPFASLPSAWEAHRARNIIESGTSDFILTKQEALRIVKLYHDVFEEFNFA
jgi:hypothetical protein